MELDEDQPYRRLFQILDEVNLSQYRQIFKGENSVFLPKQYINIQSLLNYVHNITSKIN